MITLLAIIASLMVVPVQNLLEAVQSRPLPDVVLSVVRKAHIEARQRNETVLLLYHGASNVLELCTEEGVLIEQVPLVHSSDMQEDAIQIYRLLPEDPEGDTIAYENEEVAAEQVFFHPSGVSTPFSVDFVLSPKPLRLVIDPFSSEPVVWERDGDLL